MLVETLWRTLSRAGWPNSDSCDRLPPNLTETTQRRGKASREDGMGESSAPAEKRIPRRTLLQAGMALGAAAPAGLMGTPAEAQPAPVFAYVGSFTSKERKARGDGINVYRVDPASGAWTHVQLVSDLVNPSFLTLDRRQRVLYSVHADLTEVSAFVV
jgi:hypothetical protein